MRDLQHMFHIKLRQINIAGMKFSTESDNFHAYILIYDYGIVNELTETTDYTAIEID